ncbi:MAG: GNAT family N-acetyltransferase [Candidatus Delongbacteria bacterium]|jgi:predicted GNAT family acetyltransferase|nr:GNAT family N-acetyltransferase [Candidatus Delongbacteria bacterium]
MVIKHDKEKQEFFAEIENKKAVLEYNKIDEDTLDYNHTFVPEELRGQKIASNIIKEGMNYAKNNGYKVIPTCPFVKAFTEKNPEFNNIIKRS